VDVPNLVDGAEAPASSGDWLEKLAPADGAVLCRYARSAAADVDAAVAAARRAQQAWARETPVARGDVVREIALTMRERRDELSELVARETGKSPGLARGETDAAIEMGLFVAGEGRRLYGRTTTSSVPHRSVSAVRRPVGVAGPLIDRKTAG
jgi:aldehyde dehydrogenase (NAD+)